MNNKAFVIVVVILAFVAAVGFMSYLPERFDAAAKVKVADFPMEIGGWKATEITLSDRDYEILETRNLFVRDYKNASGDMVTLYVVYSENNRKVTHPPELCLTGGGLTIVDKATAQLTGTLRAVKLTVEKGDARELVVYWFKAGNLNTDRYVKQQLKVVFDLLFGKRASCALIRMSARVKDNNEDAALSLIKAFSAQVEPLLAKYVP